MSEQQFSTRGDAVTPFERQLVAQCPMEFPESMTDVWMVIARRIGIDSLVIVFDEIGAEKVHVPTREEFFATLYRPMRDAQIRALRATGLSLKEIGRRVGLTHPMVLKVLAETSRDASNKKI